MCFSLHGNRTIASNLDTDDFVLWNSVLWPILLGMKRARDPKATRNAILRAAFEKVHRQGFQAAGLGDILAATEVTKGAFYHHFPSKMDLGYALVEEALGEYVRSWWLDPLEDSEDPIDGLARIIQERLSSDIPRMIPLGCPLNNLAQEMACADEGFRQRVETLYRMWRKGLARALRRGQQRDHVRADIDADAAATFIVASLEGAFGLAKNANSLEVFQECMGGLSHFLTSLRP
jgi:TetR/AcrR family transcriptional regulator, transcriptional repressor for nem operon